MSLQDARPEPEVNPSAHSAASLEEDSAQALRRRAVALAAERAGGMPENLEVLSPEAARRALHELRVHQIELEMQTRNCAARRRNWKARGRGISTCTIWRRWAISRSANTGPFYRPI